VEDQMKKNAILDTNIFLHYNIQDVDWCKELGATEIELIVCSTVLRELDEKKQEALKSLAKRASRNLDLIESLDGKPDGIRKNVRLTALGTEPKIEWDRWDLDPEVDDDRIIATIIGRNNIEDVLVTEDTGPRIKAKQRNIKCIKLQSGRIPEAKSAEEIELEKLRKENEQLKNRIPKLSLFLYSQEQGSDEQPKFSLTKPRLRTASETAKIIAEKDGQFLAKMTRIQDSRISGGMTGRAQIARANYLRAYGNYLNKLNRNELLRGSILELRFSIYCGGTVPAEDVYCMIEFPKGFEILEEDDLQELLEAPEEPVAEPIDAWIPGSANARTLMNFPPLLEPFNVNSSGPKIIINENTIEVMVERIQIRFEQKLTFYAKLPEPESPKNFQINYELDATHLPDPIKGYIPVLLIT
jgi:rRNA-processing protein FCF1